MDRKKEARLSMYDAVIAYCNNNNALIATVPAFQNAFTSFQSIVDNIRATAQLEASVITGITTDKSQVKANLSVVAANLAAMIFAYASNVNNNVLKEQVNFTPSELKLLKDEKLIAACSNIRDAANANIASLADYGITAANITDFQSMMDGYSAKVSSPRNAVSQRSSYSKTLTTLFKQADDALKNQMDKMAQKFNVTNEDFYNTYKSNRIIIDPGSSPTQIAGTITSAANNQPVEGALVQLVGNGLSNTTDAQGNYILKSVAIGKQSVKITKAGFADDTIDNILVKLGKTATADAVITAMPV
jgi:hypothetical protein